MIAAAPNTPTGPESSTETEYALALTPAGTASDVVSIPESGRLGPFELLVVVSEMSRQAMAPGLLKQISLDDVSPELR